MTPNIIIVGAGLSGLMTAWRILDVNADARVMIIDGADTIAGDHTWSFNLSDVSKSLEGWLSPFIAHRWESYSVRFPQRTRRLAIVYATGDSKHLRKAVQPLIDAGRLSLKLGVGAAQINEGSVQLENQERITADCVIDARGFKPRDDVRLGYQKFVGHTIRTAKPHGLDAPIIMDATAEQIDGYRFVYCLPFSDTQMLVEDTYYTDGPEMHTGTIAKRIASYITRQGWGAYEITRREAGVLPITLAAKDRFNPVEPPLGAPQIGIRGGFYHAVTGYSLPNAVHLADVIAKTLAAKPDNIAAAVKLAVWEQACEHYKRERFFRLLNRLLFHAAKPEERYIVLQRFYGLPEGLIRRFYNGGLTKMDKLRILAGKPPVPITKALANFSEALFLASDSN